MEHVSWKQKAREANLPSQTCRGDTTDAHYDGKKEMRRDRQRHRERWRRGGTVGVGVGVGVGWWVVVMVNARVCARVCVRGARVRERVHVCVCVASVCHTLTVRSDVQIHLFSLLAPAGTAQPKYDTTHHTPAQSQQGHCVSCNCNLEKPRWQSPQPHPVAPPPRAGEASEGTNEGRRRRW